LDAKDYTKKAIEAYNAHRYKDAEILFKKAIEFEPNYAEGYANLGALYAKFKMYDKAIELYKHSIKLKPTYAGAWTNIGNALNKTKKHEEAVFCHQRAIALSPNEANHYSNCASAYKNLGRFNLAEKYYKKAIELNPNHINAHFDLSTVLLQTSKYEEGWEEYEWRFKKDEMKNHLIKYKEIFNKPRYDGRDLKNNESVLVHAEQGFGDAFMVARYLYDLKQKGAKVILYLRDGMAELFETMECVDEVYVRDKSKLPSYDFQISFMSLPIIFDKSLKNITKHYPYFKIDEKYPLPKNDKLKIGIVWGASNTGESYADKVFDIRYFTKLAKHKDVEVYSLQVGEDSKDIQKYALENDITDFSGVLDNFYTTAKIINSLDLVITSDTSVAHLAGGMGKLVWILLQRVPDWRWGVYGEKSVWYPSAKLFWQYSLGDFDSVFKQVYDEMQNQYGIKVIDDRSFW